MNWYRILKFASNNIIFPDDIRQQIDNISKICVDYYLANRQDKTLIGEFSFINPYTNQQDLIPAVVYPYDFAMKGLTAVFNPQRRIITIFPYHNKVQNINKNNLFLHFKENISHEITHAIDPKFLIPDWWRNRNKISYYSKEEEFDAYSKQMEITIKSNLNKENFAEFKNWLVSSDLSLLPQYLDFYKEMLSFWYKYKPEYVKKLKQRLYNDFIGKSNYGI